MYDATKQYYVNTCIPYHSLFYFLRFFFPRNFTYNGTHVHRHWAVMISSVYVQRWATSEDDRTVQAPGDEDDLPEETVSDRVLLVRRTPPGLYQNFMVSEGNSYACAAPAFSTYSHANFSVENETLSILGYITNSTDSSKLSLASLQAS